jgi:hypothetical protein
VSEDTDDEWFWAGVLLGALGGLVDEWWHEEER